MKQSTMQIPLRALTSALLLSTLGMAAGCTGAPVSSDRESFDDVNQAVTPGQALAGRPLFVFALSLTNGRACATCHPESDHTALLPSTVAARLAQDPNDPLFNAIDADDPAAPVPTYRHLLKGLVRVTLPLPANVDLIDTNGQVVTPAARTISVWRGVPSVENTAYTSAFLYDGRAATLQQQALGALRDHSQIRTAVGNGEQNLIAAFEQTLFSSDRAKGVADQIAAGVAISDIPDPEASMPLTAEQQRGRAVYNRACTGCHGSATDNVITNRAAHDQLFFQLGSDGNIVYQSVSSGPAVPALSPRPTDEFLNVGFGFASYRGQIGQFPAFNSDVELPRYRLRFYADGSRTVRVTDLPPIPVTASGQPFDLNPAINSQTGAPITGPNRAPQWWSTDPGRSLITGDPAEFEAFDVPQLRGVANTAPYMHDNSHAALADVVNTYSRDILPMIPALGLPRVSPPEAPSLPSESLTPQQKADLLAFLNVF